MIRAAASGWWLAQKDSGLDEWHRQKGPSAFSISLSPNAVVIKTGTQPDRPCLELAAIPQFASVTKEQDFMHRKSNHIEHLIADARYILKLPAKNMAFTVVSLVAIPLCLCSSLCRAQVDPTWVHRFLPDIAEKSVDLSTSNCHYRPIFGEGDSVTRIVRSVARFGEVKLDPGGACRPVAYAREEQIYVILEGSGVLQYGGDSVPVRKNDFMYLPPGITHTISASADQPCRLVVMGFRIPPVMTSSRRPSSCWQTWMRSRNRRSKDTRPPSSTNFWSVIGRARETKSPRDTWSPVCF